MKYRTIIEKSIGEIIEKKSRFISEVYHIENKEQAEAYIRQTKKKYHDAKHHCYAYTLLDLETNQIITKCTDDGEPSGTAGAPILHLLTSNNLVNVLAIVTRYFGGTLLGTGGLVKAYTQATQTAINSANIKNAEKGYFMHVEMGYEMSEMFKYFCKKNDINIINIEYSNKIAYDIEINKEKREKIFLEFDKMKQNNILFDGEYEKLIIYA